MVCLWLWVTEATIYLPLFYATFIPSCPCPTPARGGRLYSSDRSRCGGDSLDSVTVKTNRTTHEFDHSRVTPTLTAGGRARPYHWSGLQFTRCIRPGFKAFPSMAPTHSRYHSDHRGQRQIFIVIVTEIMVWTRIVCLLKLETGSTRYAIM